MPPAPPETCDYCGLPVPRPWRPRLAPAGAAKAYCCYGCRFAAAVTGARGEQGAAGWMLLRLGVAAFLTLNVLVFTMALWTQDLYGDPGGPPEAMAGLFRGLFRYLGLAFALPVLVLLGGPLGANAWASLRRRNLTADLLLLVGVAASYAYSVVSVLRDEGPVYFEVGCVVLLLVTLGRWLEATGKLRTTAAIEALERLLPGSARVVRAWAEVSIPLEDVRVADCLHVLPGERIPCDGRVARDAALVDEQVLTGESHPATREVGDRVFGGSQNLDGDLWVTVTAPARGGALTRMIDLVREAQRTRGHYQRLADRVTAWFLPAVIVIALATAAWHGGRHGLDRGVLAGLAVLLIACPCALGLATPMAVWTALGQAARAQVLFRGGEALERLASLRAVRIDKTGTVTTGTPTVADFAVPPGADRETVLCRAAGLAALSPHVFAEAVRHFAAEERVEGLANDEFRELRTLPGRGLAAVAAGSGEMVYLGSPRLMDEGGCDWDEALAAAAARAREDGLPLTCIGWGRAVRGVFVFQEVVRHEAREAVARLHGLGLDVALLTGDSSARGAALGRELALPVHAELLPEDKVAALDDARRRIGPVGMVGDGINDAPALAAADVGIALGCGADVARDAAAVCLLGNDLNRVPWAVALARRTVRIIRQNLFWAFAYNVAGIGLACTGRLNPVVAALAMVVSSFLVVANSLRLGGEPAAAGDEGPPAAAVPRPVGAARTGERVP